MKPIKLTSKDSTLVKENETYTLIDNTDLTRLVVSKTILNPEKNTNGHSHPGKEEVYHFTTGTGYIQIDEETFNITGGDIVLIPDGAFHKVYNTSEKTTLEFVCIFEGKRNH